MRRTTVIHFDVMIGGCAFVLLVQEERTPGGGGLALKAHSSSHNNTTGFAWFRSANSAKLADSFTFTTRI